MISVTSLAFNAGLADLKLIDPVEGGAMRGLIAYPTRHAAGMTRKSSYSVGAVEGAEPAQGPFPLILISHGTGGSHLGHHDSLTHLARCGFVAASVLHPRDNYLDTSGFGTDLQRKGRPYHIRALLDYVLTNESLSGRVDPERVGFLGFSAGGYTGLVLAGGRPDMGKFDDYCREQPDDMLMCRPGMLAERRPDLVYLHDRRIKAAVLMAPALGFVFDRAALSDVRVPLRIYRSTADEILRYPYNAEHVHKMLSVPHEYILVEGAGHYVFLAPCSEELRAAIPSICEDPPGIDRVAFHQRLNVEIADFFTKTLGQV